MTRHNTLSAQILVALVFLAWAATAEAEPTFEAAYLFLGNHPHHDGDTGWHCDTQGIAHDSEHWYITNSCKDDGCKGTLWKVPATQNLALPITCNSGEVSCLVFPTDFPDLEADGINKFGGLDYFEHEEHGAYLFVMSECNVCEDVCNYYSDLGPTITVIDADAFSYLGHFLVASWQDHGAWCAVHPVSGTVYSAADMVGQTALLRYEVDWDALVSEPPVLTLQPLDPFYLLDENGDPMELGVEGFGGGIQGGTFSPSGRLLFMMADGIHVFDVSTGRRVVRSTNGSGHFNYQYDPGFFVREEPEGLTYWDLDAPGTPDTPDIGGQLHAIMLDNDNGGATTEDDVYLKHYSVRIYVDGTYSGEEVGTPDQPFNSISEAYNLVWSRLDGEWFPGGGGAIIQVETPGTYAEPTTLFQKRLALTSDDGPVMIVPEP
ncbi:hypothetical protein ACFL6M_05660 [Candidatus Eisenbacteria bacterium]|uniref:Uncharacterized protein n=1 Tax=Eiseniibacteriota bacterium TaxID=2212470 RepID=A0ABV6YL66_UNCEI